MWLQQVNTGTFFCTSHYFLGSCFRNYTYSINSLCEFLIIRYFSGVTTYGNGPERTETDLRKYRNRLLWVPKRTSVDTETDRNRLQLIPKRTSMGTRKGRVGYDRNDSNKVMYVLVGRNVGR